MGMGGQGVQVRGYGRAGEYRYVDMGSANSAHLYAGIQRAYNHSLDLKLKRASEYIGTNDSKPLLISFCPLIFQWHTYDTDSRVLSVLMKTSYIISDKHHPSLLRSLY